jgi:hypothetical protein
MPRTVNPSGETKPYDVILVNPLVRDQRSIPNIGLTAIDAYLTDQGYRTRVVDIKQLAEFTDQSDVFGFSVWDHTYLPARGLTHRLEGKMVVWGGWAVMSRPEFILRENPNVDFAVLQDGEERMLRLLQARKDPEVFNSIDGIAFRDKNGEIVVRPPTGFFDMNKVPSPDEQTAELPSRADGSGMVYLELARGCYGRCAYCQHISKMRFRDAIKVAQEIQFFHDRGYKRFYVGNDNAMAKTRLLGELVDELENRKLPVELMFSGRPNDVLKGLDVLEKIFKSDYLGLYAVEMGIESNSQRMLELLSRGLTPETNRKAMDALIQLKTEYSPSTKINANIILFTHWEMSITDFIDNVLFIGDYGCSRDTMSLRLYGVAGTPVWDQMTDEGFETNPGLAQRITEYPFRNQEVEQLYDKLVRQPLANLERSNMMASLVAPDAARQALNYYNFQIRVHEKVMEFYRSGDIERQVRDFVAG